MMLELNEELREWLRPISPLTAFAKSLKNEGESGSPQTDPSKEVKVDSDLLAGLDLDELPTDVKERITKLKDAYEDTFKKNTELEDRRKQSEEFGRKQQSEAMQAKAVIRAHNLDGQPAVQQSPEQQAIQSRFERLKAGGMEDKAAMAYAKMLADEAKQQRDEILSSLGPLVGSVGSMQADRVLSDAKQGYQQVFANNELSQQIHQNVGNLVKSGTPVTKETVDHLVSMAWGSHILKNPDALKTQMQQQQIPNFGNNPFNGGGGYVPPQQNGNQGPQATQNETVTIMNAVTAELRREVDAKKGRK